MASKPYKPCPCHQRMGNDFYFLPKGSCLFTDGDCVGGAHRHDEREPSPPPPPPQMPDTIRLLIEGLIGAAAIITFFVWLLWPLHW